MLLHDTYGLVVECKKVYVVGEWLIYNRGKKIHIIAHIVGGEAASANFNFKLEHNESMTI